MSDPPPEVADAFAALPLAHRATFDRLRHLILDVAATTEDVGALEETLKWGQPSYRPTRPRSGTTVRLGLSRDERPALLVHCQTSLVGDFRSRYGGLFDFEDNRALVLRDDEPLPEAALRHCVALALTYHVAK